MKFSIRRDGKSLCRSCDSAHIMEDDRGRETFFCHWGHPTMVVPPNIVKCSKYEEVGRMSEHDAKKIGWVIEHRGGKIGFKPPKREDD